MIKYYRTEKDKLVSELKSDANEIRIQTEENQMINNNLEISNKDICDAEANLSELKIAEVLLYCLISIGAKIWRSRESK